MSSTGDEDEVVADVDSQLPQTTHGAFTESLPQPPPSAQPSRQLPSSPPAPPRASLDDPDDAQTFSPSDASDDDDRSNRFHGPSSTWRHYTEQERQLAASLDQQRANDLSIHLYNAHALKRRLVDASSAAVAKPWNDKARWLRRDENGKIPWHPDRNWTAWPLPPEEVPRGEEAFGIPVERLLDDEETVRREEEWTPSKDLAGEIEALMLRRAKEKMRRRRWAGTGAGDDIASAHGLSTAEPRDGNADKLDSGEPNVGADSSSSPDLPLPNPLNSHPTGERQAEPSQEPHHEPAFLADDDKAHAILHPSVRHIIAKFDDLLLGLHKSRQGHRERAFASASRSKSRVSKRRSGSKSAATASSARSRERSVKGTAAADEVAGDGGEDSATEKEDGGREAADSIEAGGNGDTRDRGAMRAGGPRRRSGTSTHNLGLRDWSEVLALAALTGWDHRVIDRTAQRCAHLFGEGMAFRVMPERSAGEERDELVEYRPEMVPESSSDDDDDGEMEVTTGVKRETGTREGWSCPYAECGRHYAAYDRAWRWREHLKRAHRLDSEQVARIEAGLRPGEAGSRGADAKDTEMDEDAEGAGEGGAEGEKEDEDEMLGAVHRDGFLQPITGHLVRGADLKTRRRRSTMEGGGRKRARVRRSGSGAEDDCNT